MVGRKKKITSANMFIVFVILSGGVGFHQACLFMDCLFVLCGVMFVFNSKRSKGMVGTIFFLVLLLPIFGPILYESQIKPLINKEINVVNGDAEVNRAFNGRVDRWENYFAIWNDLPLYSHFVGISFTGEEKSPIMLSGGCTVIM